jgi:sec-independent protein translocase protein TatA
MFGGLANPLDLMIILAVALVVLGPRRRPDAGRSPGSALKGFRETVSGDEHEPTATLTETVTAPVATTATGSAHTSTDAPVKAAA